MTHHLLELSFGPVQGFIAAARRSRDLWAGSRLLSEAVRAAARHLQQQGATLIYPTRAAVQNAEGSNLSNVLLASIPSANGTAVAALAKAAQQAARDRIREVADAELARWQSVAPDLRSHLWKQQIAGVLDTYAAWSAWSGENSTYRASYDTLKKAFAQRKNTRDFMPAPTLLSDDAGLPKSSLDGANESVLPKDEKQRRRGLARRMGVAKGEQLDAIGCVKRSFGRREDFSALTRIAADAWLRTLPPEVLAGLRDAYEPLVPLELATRCRGNEGIYDAFPYDAGLLFGGALDAAQQEAKADNDPEALDALQRLRAAFKEAGSAPNPYVALMSADGDRMGVFVDSARTAREHGEISSAIAAFADRVPSIAREHRGHAIFNGGEDLMVAFPLQNVIDGARALAKAFDDAVRPLVDRLIDKQTKDEQGRPTLRAGVAICHVTEPMGYIRDCADAAEKVAKGEAGGPKQGNALALVLNGRGGHVVPVRLSFEETAQGDFAALQRWRKAYADGELPSRVAYDCREIASLQAQLKRGESNAETLQQLEEILRVEFERVLERARVRGGDRAIPRELGAAIAERAKALESWETLSNELVLARWLSATTAGELGERGE